MEVVDAVFGIATIVQGQAQTSLSKTARVTNTTCMQPPHSVSLRILLALGLSLPPLRTYTSNFQHDRYTTKPPLLRIMYCDRVLPSTPTTTITTTRSVSTSTAITTTTRKFKTDATANVSPTSIQMRNCFAPLIIMRCPTLLTTRGPLIAQHIRISILNCSAEGSSFS